VDGTPVLDIKPWFTEFGPRGDVRQAPWSVEMLGRYYAVPPQA
jgi:tRNA (Thr-GGU) A37 N-methylase